MEISEEQLQKMIQTAVDAAIQQTAENLARTFITMPQARAIARDAVPASIRDLDSTAGTGNVLTLGGNGAAAWGILKALLEIKGDMVLFKGVFLREYDENGTIVAAGSEINPASFSSLDAYKAALTAAGHVLKLTYDWMRAGQDISVVEE